MKRKHWQFLFYCILAAALIFMVISLGGCMTEKRRQAVCRTCPLKIERHDSTVTKIEEKIREVTVNNTVTVTKWLPNPCAELCDENGQLKPGFKKTVKSDKGTTSTLFVKDGKLAIMDSLGGFKAAASFRDTTTQRFSKTLEQVPTRCDLEHLSKWDSFFIITGRILWAALLLAILVWIIRKRFFS